MASRLIAFLLGRRLALIGSLIVVLTSGFPLATFGAMELLARETFEGVKTLNSENPGNLGAWSMGAWNCRPVGPRLAGAPAPGWSGDAQGVMTQTRWDLSQTPYSGARANGMIGCWVRFEDLTEAGYYNSPIQANPAVVLQLHSGADNAPFQTIGVTNTKLFLSRTQGSNWVATSLVQEKTWYWVQIEWVTTDSKLTAKASYQPLGGQLTELSSQTFTLANYQTANAYVMNAPVYIAPGQHYMWRGRLGGAVIASISTMGDGEQMPDLLPPVVERHVWYLNPATGDDQNDGLSPSRAWRTVTKFNKESEHAGMLSSLNGDYNQGDILIIDTSDDSLDLGELKLQIRTEGLTIRPPAGQEVIRLRAHKDISAPGTVWTRSGDHGQVWMTTDGQSKDLTDVVIWEDNLWLNHPVGISAADVMDELEATPGSFFSNGVTLFLHPFGSTDPNSDGKNYTRSRFRESGGSAVLLLAQNLYVKGLDVRKTALARSVDNDPYTSYGIHGEQGFGGVTLLQSCYVDYAGKHCIGFTDSNSGRDVIVDACQVEQGTPYSSQTPWVDYNGIAEASGNRTTYLNCINRRPCGKIGSTDGVSMGYTSYYAHNNGIGVQFDCIQFIGGIYGGQFSTGAGVRKMVFERASVGGGNVSADEVSVNRCVMTQIPIGNGATDGLLEARHNVCLFTDGIFNGASNAYIRGKVVYEGNTFDLRPYISRNNAQFSLFRRVAELDFIFRNNIFISPADQEFNVISEARSTDRLLFAHNLYQTGASQIVVSFFDDGITTRLRSLQEWQSLGYDEGSVAVNDLQMNASYVPNLASPYSFLGTDLGMEPDFSGRFFQSRKSIGAFEPADSFAAWKIRHFTKEELSDDSVSGPESDADMDGVPNLLEFALGRDPQIVENAPCWGFERETTANGQHVFRLKVKRSLYARGITWRPEISVDMKMWRVVQDVEPDVIGWPALEGWEMVDYQLPMKVYGEFRGYGRLVLSVSEE